MLAIVNVTKDDTQELDDYEIRINSRVIGKFQHKRVLNGAAQCLRDAADALDKQGLDTDVRSIIDFGQDLDLQETIIRFKKEG